MNPALILTLIAAVLATSACDLDPTGAHFRSAHIRFVNAIPGLSSDVAFTSHNAFVSGSIVAFPGVTATCSDIRAGEMVPMGFGMVNEARAGLAGNALVAYPVVNLFAGWNYTFIATGTAAQPRMIYYEMIPSSPTPGDNAAYVWFINAVPGSQVDAVLGSSISTSLTENMTFGRQAFASVTAGANTVTIRGARDTTVVGSQSVTFNRGSTTIFVIAATATGGYQLFKIPNC